MNKMVRKKIPYGLKGVGTLFPPLLTKDASGINVEETKRYTRWLLEKGCITIVPGSICATLSDEEKALLWKTVAETAGDKAAVMPYLGCRPQTIEGFVKEIKLAESTGVNSLKFIIRVLVNALGLFKHPPWPEEYEEAAYQTFKSGFEATELPVMLYNNAAGVPCLPVKFMVRLANEFDNFSGLKTNPFYQLSHEIKALKPLGIPIAKGLTEKEYVAALAMGCDGFVSPLGCGIPDMLSDLYTAFHEGDLDKANAVEHEILPIVDILLSDAEIFTFPLKKYLIAARGFDIGGCRPPEIPLPKRLQEQVDNVFKKLGKYKDAENFEK